MTQSITQMLHNWKDGDEQAAYDLDKCLRAELLSLVRSRRTKKLSPRIDSEGVVNAAMRSFLSGIRNEEFHSLRNRDDAKRILAHFSIRVLQDEIRHAESQKRDARREVANSAGQLEQAVYVKEITPEESVAALDFFEKFQEVVRQVHKKSIVILEMRLEGLTNEQISHEIGLGVRTVQVIIKRMIDKWQNWVESENGDE